MLAGWGAMKVLKPFISGFKGVKSLFGSSKTSGINFVVLK